MLSPGKMMEGSTTRTLNWQLCCKNKPYNKKYFYFYNKSYSLNHFPFIFHYLPLTFTVKYTISTNSINVQMLYVIAHNFLSPYPTFTVIRPKR